MLRLLLSAHCLVYLSLRGIPHSAYVSPEVMASCLSAMSGLETLILHFHSGSVPPRSDLEGQRLPLLTPCALPALTVLDFQGVNPYLESLVARIDAPLLCDLSTFMSVTFNVPHLHRFINHAKRLKTFCQATLSCRGCSMRLTLSSQVGTVDYTALELGIQYTFGDAILSSLAQICNLTSPLHSTVERLDIIADVYPVHRDDSKERKQWLDILGLFPALKNLYLCNEMALRVTDALKKHAREGGKGCCLHYGVCL
ncbi:hypothetical protein F5148DRAFT_599712 [Russula earlei]|uniref:Uncharacterized protein n=1 Tax=Russula earlei TaxID=71964 RepID=A0ACC0UFQ6_9AGAM|nr:hypothetical protein F5148DRAFT_599712 [Russula earlei]